MRSVAGLFAEAIKRIHEGESVSSLFDGVDPTHAPPRQSTLGQVLDQIDYGVQLIGIDHVGIGSDFDGVGGELAEGLRTVADFPNLVAGLQARGYDDAGIGKILGGNLLRTWARIEAGAVPQD